MKEDVKDYYNKNAEFELNRLTNNYSVVEFKSTLHLVEKYVTKGATILDCGSGPGRYSIELLSRGYYVTLLDLSNESIEIAKKNIAAKGLVASGYFAESATNLEIFENESFDSVLVLGPMYHLHDYEERLKVLRDVNRILKPDGIAIVAYINSFGLLRASVSEFPDGFCEQALNDTFLKGNLKLSSEESFTSVYFTLPDFAVNEVKSAKLKVISTAGAESFLSGMKMQLDDLKSKNEDLYNEYVDTASKYCELEYYKNTTEHFLVVAQKMP